MAKTFQTICAICGLFYPAHSMRPDAAGHDALGKLIAGPKNMLEQVPACCMMCEDCFGESEEFNRIERVAKMRKQGQT